LLHEITHLITQGAFMASIKKQENGKYRAFIRRKDSPSQSKTFSTKREAERWAREQEGFIDKHGISLSKEPFRTAIEKYLEKVTPTKKSERTERLRLNKFIEGDPLAYVAINKITPGHIEDWRDRRLKEVSAGTVLREWNTLSNIFHYCVAKWKTLIENPMSKADRPKTPEPRSRRPSEDEIDRLCLSLDYEPYSTPELKIHLVGACMLFAIETAMRASEITGLTWEHVSDKSVHLPKTKNGAARDVPLSTKAKRLIDTVRGQHKTKVFNVSSSSLDALFRKHRDRALIENLHFHDTRREALTRLSKKLDVMSLAKMSGHRDLKILLNTYYNPDIEDLADKLD